MRHRVRNLRDKVLDSKLGDAKKKCDQRRVLRRICFLKIEDADLVRRTAPRTANPGFVGFGDFRCIVGNVRMHNCRFFGDGLVAVAGGLMHMRERSQQERREHSEAPLNGYKALHFLGFPLTRLAKTA